MKADLIRRLMKAIANGSQRDLERLAPMVISSERKSGHSKLADDLESILQSKKKEPSQRLDNASSPALQPLSRRHRELLISPIARESLEHHMVLPVAVEARFKRIEQEFAARDRLLTYGLRPRKTILLHGPPGCGKSLGAKRLAWNTGLPLMKVRFDALVSSYFGETASNLRSIFDAAASNPCVMLLDECDFIARSRVGSKDVGEAARIVNTLLQLMEEYDAPGFLVATTNVEDALDNAIFRRFDEVLYVPPPSQAQIEEILKVTLSALRVDPSIEFHSVAKMLNGASAATVVKVARDASKSAVLEGDRIVALEHLMSSAKEAYGLGPEGD